MRYACSKGTAILLVTVWGYVIFTNTADRKLLSPLDSFSWTMISITVIMILRVYAMWSRSKRILWVLLFAYAPQVIISFGFTGIYENPNTYISGTSRAELIHHYNLTQPALISCPPFLQSQQLNSLISQFATPHSTKSYPSSCMPKSLDFSSVLHFWFSLSSQPRSGQSRCTKRPGSGSLIGTSNNS